MKKRLLILFIMITIGLTSLMFVKVDPPANYRVMTTQQAKEVFKTKGDYIILDVRRVDEYENGHIPRAINIPLDEIDTSATKILTDFNQEIYVYCRSGNRSVTASKKLVKLGYTNIIEFGGILNWGPLAK